MPKLKGALFGCGMISEFHLRAWQRIDDVEIVALGNRTLSRAEARRDEFMPQARVYDNLRDLLAVEQLDFVDILTPPALHKEHCLEALESGLHVICQKPLTDTLESSRELVDAFDHTDAILAVHENHRYRPWFQEILRRAREGFFGMIRFARFEQFDPREPGEFYKRESPRGILLEYGTHVVDMVHALFGPPARVTGSAYNLNPRITGESLVHLTCDCFAATATIDIAWKPAGASQGSVLIVGDQGEACYEGTMTRGKSSRFRIIEGSRTIIDESRSPYDDYMESFNLFQRDLVSALIGQGSVPQPAGENLKVLETTFAGYSSIESGRPIELN